MVENIGSCESLPRVHHQHPRDLRTPQGEFDSVFASATHFEDINWVTELILPNLFFIFFFNIFFGLFWLY